MTIKRPLRLAAAAAVLALPLTFTACQDLAENAAEDALREEGIDADLDNGQIEIDSTDGGVVTGKLPKGFPESIPVIDGEILAGAYTKNPDTWNATVKVDEPGGDKVAPFDTAEQDLLDAGFQSKTDRVDNGVSIVGDYEGEGYNISLAVTDSAGQGIVVNYLVSAL